MSAIDEGIVREFFEQNGFFVRQVRKYQVQSRKKTREEEIDLLVYNHGWKPGTRKPEFMLFPSELPCIHRAVVSIRAWHTDVFTPGMLKGSPEIFSFLESSVVRQAAKFFPETTEDQGNPAEGEAEHITKILVLPALPTSEPYRSQSIQLLQERGVDAIVSFRTMLLDLIESVETNRNYGKSEALQVIRILKNYDLVRDPQMDLPGSRDRRGSV